MSLRRFLFLGGDFGGAVGAEDSTALFLTVPMFMIHVKLSLDDRIRGP